MTIWPRFKKEEMQTERCDGCMKPIESLIPFGKSGDPIKGNHEGKKLVCRKRFYYERYNPELHRISKEIKFYGNGLDNTDDLIARYGKDKAEDAYMYLRLSGMTRKSMECRDCIVKLRLPMLKPDSNESVNQEIDDILKLKNYEN